MRNVLFLAGLATLAAACSSGPGSSDGGAGAAGSGGGGTTGVAGTTGGGGNAGGAGGGGAGGGGGNPACATASENGACTAEGVTCGTCTDVCQFCNLLRCMSGKWQRMESVPAPCFMCGPDLRCQGYAQYCDVTMGGAQGAAASYRCTALPAACKTTPTCACLQSQGIAGSGNCAMGAQGEVTVTLLAPGGGSNDAASPLTACPTSRPTTGAACTGTFTCNYNESCTATGCCFHGYGCSGGSVAYLGFNDGCAQGGN